MHHRWPFENVIKIITLIIVFNKKKKTGQGFLPEKGGQPAAETEEGTGGGKGPRR
ncbi:hypothetical protein SDC9_73556 [bioreactor metagenome]|uniref:Uncharacterized protein n=1 Tax=bioreactor metagenome TaxID=1076179 RepID=A0A644YGN3_9ZZZZ